MDLTHNIIEYVNCCVGAFANRFKLSLTQSYAYLRRFKGIDFLIDCYAAEHTLSIDDAVEDIAILCQKEWRSNRMLKLFHGSNVVVDKIDLCRSRKGKDFGCGF